MRAAESAPAAGPPTLFGCKAGAAGRVIVLGVPYDRGSPPSHAGAAAGPAELRRLSAPSFCRFDRHGLYDHARRQVVASPDDLSDLGDLHFRVHGSDDSYLARVSDAASVIAAEGRKLLVLGGDHLVTLAVLRGIARRTALQVVQLDAHQDYERLEPGERPTHASFVAHIAKERLASRVFQIGVRGYGWGQPEPPPGVQSIAPAALAEALLPGVPTYLTVDTDGFDPALAGAVSFPEHGGLTLADLEAVLARISEKSTLIGADWTEYNPSLDTRNALTGRFIVRGLGTILRAFCAAPSPLEPSAPPSRSKRHVEAAAQSE